MYTQLAQALQSDRYSHSDLGDGTSVLTSLSDSKIISLNTLGTMIVNTLTDKGDNTVEKRIELLCDTITKQYNIPLDQSKRDIDNFTRGLAKQLHASLDSTQAIS